MFASAASRGTHNTQNLGTALSVDVLFDGDGLSEAGRSVGGGESAAGLAGERLCVGLLVSVTVRSPEGLSPPFTLPVEGMAHEKGVAEEPRGVFCCSGSKDKLKSRNDSYLQLL